MKKLLILTIAGLLIAPTCSAFYFGFGNAGFADQAITRGQEEGKIPTVPDKGNGDGNGSGPLSISDISYSAQDEGDYYYIRVTWKTNKPANSKAYWDRDQSDLTPWPENGFGNKTNSGLVISHTMEIKYLLPNAITYFVIRSEAGSEKVTSQIYSQMIPTRTDGNDRVYDVRLVIYTGDGTQVALCWYIDSDTPASTYTAKRQKNGGSWYNFTVNRTGQFYSTNCGYSGTGEGDVIGIQIQGPVGYGAYTQESLNIPAQGGKNYIVP